MKFDAAAEQVQKGDRDRFMASLAAPPEHRGPLLVLYAFNLEIARAPWQTAEPLIAEMRLQFWADTIDAAVRGATPPRHPVAGPLAEMVAAGQLDASDLIALIEARRLDAGAAPHADARALQDYLGATAGGLMWMAARLLGAAPEAEDTVRRFGSAAGMAALLAALAELGAAGRRVLADDSDQALAALVGQALAGMRAARRNRRRVPKSCLAAMLAGWQADAILRRARKNPAAIREGRLGLSEFHRRRLLAWRAATGRW